MLADNSVFNQNLMKEFFIMIGLSKFFSGLGLVLDLLGVLILLYVERQNRKIDILTDNRLEKRNFVDEFNAAYEGVELDSIEEDIAIKELEEKLPNTKAFEVSSIALILIVIGFMLQLIALIF